MSLSDQIQDHVLVYQHQSTLQSILWKQHGDLWHGQRSPWSAWSSQVYICMVLSYHLPTHQFITISAATPLTIISRPPYYFLESPVISCIRPLAGNRIQDLVLCPCLVEVWHTTEALTHNTVVNKGGDIWSLPRLCTLMGSIVINKVKRDKGLGIV